MTPEIVKNLTKNGARYNQDVYVSDQMKKSCDEQYKSQGYVFNVKEKKDVAIELLRLPEYVNYQGIQFRFKLFNNQGEIRIVYEIDSTDDNSPHKEQVDKYGCWENHITGHVGSFLLLNENIKNEEGLFGSIDFFCETLDALYKTQSDWTKIRELISKMPEKK